MKVNEWSSDEALKALVAGNEIYVSEKTKIDIGRKIRLKTSNEGQNPHAIIIACSDSRVIPEVIFNAGIGEIFVIRVAGNVMDNHQLGSIEYACDHLGVNLVVVLGHNHCGAVEAAIHHNPDGYIKFITDEIVRAIGDEKDSYNACVLNVKQSIKVIEDSIIIRKDEKEHGLKVLGAVYHLEDGRVDFIK